jgi:hypothetical protein
MASLGNIVIGGAIGYLAYRLFASPADASLYGGGNVGRVVTNAPPDPKLAATLFAVGGGVSIEPDGSTRYVIPSRVSPTIQSGASVANPAVVPRALQPTADDTLGTPAIISRYGRTTVMP